MTSIQEALKSSDWVTRKAASAALGEIASSGGSNYSSLKSYDMSRYLCCGGYMPCSGRCGESKCPEFCLCTEVFCCFANSVASTRFLLQDQFNIQTTKCDNCIIGFMVCLQQLACICSLVAMIADIDEISEASQLLSCLSDWVYCTPHYNVNLLRVYLLIYQYSQHQMCWSNQQG